LLNEYYYTLEEAEILEENERENFTFCKFKVLDLSNDEAQYFLDVTETRAISGYGTSLAR
jgi:hypothetical protein